MDGCGGSWPDSFVKVVGRWPGLFTNGGLVISAGVEILPDMKDCPHYAGSESHSADAATFPVSGQFQRRTDNLNALL
jgi:hypothetical protein